MSTQTVTAANGIKITFARPPATSAMQALIAGKTLENPRQEASSVKKLTRVSLTSGKQTPQEFSSLEAFSMRPVNEAEDYIMSYRKYWNAKARKPRGKKQKGAATIRAMYLN